jgi:uncharacterized membrane protein
MSPSRRPHIVNGGLLVLLLGGSLWAYPALPDQIPRHFGVGGEADAYWATTPLRWMLLPMIAVGSAGLVYGAAGLIGRAPDAVNAPSQEQYDRLSPGQKRVVAAYAQRVVYWMTTPLLGAFGAGQGGAYHVATTPATALPPAVMIAIAGGLLAVLGLAGGLGWGMRRRIRELAEDAD